jgi:hypothetical protein
MDEYFIQLVHEGKEGFFAQFRTEAGIAGNIDKQYGDQPALTAQATTVGEDFAGQVGGEVALELVQPVV